SVLLTAGLSFVGAGIDPPTPELGAMIASGAKFMILGQWWLSLFPGVALGLIVFWFANGGDQLAALVTPRRRSRNESANFPTPSVDRCTAFCTGTSALLVKDLTVVARNATLVDHVSFSLARGESVALVGPAS